MVRLGRFVARLWYYFRMGYATYLTFLFGYVSTLITVYYLAIKSVPVLLDVFPKFIPFAALATVIGVPSSIAIGWLHLKRSLAYSSEMDIGVEANPYYYKLPPGYTLEVWGPLYLELLLQMKKLLAANKLLNEAEKERIESLEKKMRILNEGGYVGSPKRRNL
jgi:hypothetical protein